MDRGEPESNVMTGDVVDAKRFERSIPQGRRILNPHCIPIPTRIHIYRGLFMLTDGTAKPPWKVISILTFYKYYNKYFLLNQILNYAPAVNGW